MAKLYRNNSSEISPCIIAQIRFALGISKKQPKNRKKCSNDYWNEVVEIIAKTNKITNYNSILR